MNDPLLPLDRRDFERHWNAFELPLLKDQFPRITVRQIAKIKARRFPYWLADAWSDRAVPEAEGKV